MKQEQVDAKVNERKGGDWLARQFFSPADLRMSPEEYAARHAHLWGCFSLHLHDYQDSGLGSWVRRLGEILSSEEQLKRCQQRYLSPEELAQTHTQQMEDF